MDRGRQRGSCFGLHDVWVDRGRDECGEHGCGVDQACQERRPVGGEGNFRGLGFGFREADFDGHGGRIPGAEKGGKPGRGRSPHLGPLPSEMGEEGGGSGEVGALVEGEAPAAGFEEPEGAAAGVVLAAVGVGAGEGVGGQGDGVGEAAGVEVGDGARGVGLFGEEEGDDVGAGVEAAAGADLGEGLVEEGFEGGAGGADAGGEVGVFEGEEGFSEKTLHSI